MDRILSIAGESGNSKSGGGDSFVDRLNCRYTVYLLTMCCLLITTKHYVGEPINCWCPAHYTSSQVDFTNSVCWTTGTYYLAYYQTRIPKEGESKRMIGYYQWVPLILVLMAILFYFPRILWMILNKSTGVAVHTITDAAIEYQYKADADERNKQMSYITNHMGRVLTESMHSVGRHRYRTMRRAFFRAYGNYLIAAYIFIKSLYLVNVIAQFLILDTFLGINYHGYGFHIFQRIINGDDWQTSDRFPRVTLCNIWIRVLGNVQRYTVQCSLPMNLVNEIIFIFIWFWLVFVFFATLCSLLKWAFISIHTGRQVDYTMARLSVMNMFENKYDNIEDAREEVTNFVRKFLERDGFLMVRLVSHNTTDITASELLFRLWDYYLKNKDSIQKLYGEGKDGLRRAGRKKTGDAPNPRYAMDTELGTPGTELKKRPQASLDANSNHTNDSENTGASADTTAPLLTSTPTGSQD